MTNTNATTQVNRAEVLFQRIAGQLPPDTEQNLLALGLFKVYFAGADYGYARAAQETAHTISVDGLMLAAQMDAVTGRTDTPQTAVYRVVEALVD